jgi:hypothetical protein
VHGVAPCLGLALVEAPPYARRYLSRSPPVVARPTYAIRNFYDEHALRNTGSSGYSERGLPWASRRGRVCVRTDHPVCPHARNTTRAPCGIAWAEKWPPGYLCGVAIRPSGSTATVTNNHLRCRDFVAMPVAQYRLALCTESRSHQGKLVRHPICRGAGCGKRVCANYTMA